MCVSFALTMISQGYTPLHLAADVGAVKVLLEHGANRDIQVRRERFRADVISHDYFFQDENEFVARQLASIAGHTEVASLLSDTQHAPSL